MVVSVVSVVVSVVVSAEVVSVTVVVSVSEIVVSSVAAVVVTVVSVSVVCSAEVVVSAGVVVAASVMRIEPETSAGEEREPSAISTVATAPVGESDTADRSITSPALTLSSSLIFSTPSVVPL